VTGCWRKKPREAAERILVALEADRPIRHWQPLHLHHAASHITGRISLLNETLAELILDRPLWLAENDRLVLRDIGARQTLGGARVLRLIDAEAWQAPTGLPGMAGISGAG
jgi:selenocysteine-specific elongation factor